MSTLFTHPARDTAEHGALSETALLTWACCCPSRPVVQVIMPPVPERPHETDLLLFPPLRAGWFLRGKPAEVPISGENAKRTVYGTINVETGDRILVAREGSCAVDFQALLRLIRQEYEGRRVVVLLDGASRHTAGASEALAGQLSLELIRLPVRCANVNPMDRLWRWGKDKVCANKQYLSIDYQAERFVEYLLGLSGQEALKKAGILSGKFWLNGALSKLFCGSA